MFGADIHHLFVPTSRPWLVVKWLRSVECDLISVERHVGTFLTWFQYGWGPNSGFEFWTWPFLFLCGELLSFIPTNHQYVNGPRNMLLRSDRRWLNSLAYSSFLPSWVLTPDATYLPYDTHTRRHTLLFSETLISWLYFITSLQYLSSDSSDGSLIIIYHHSSSTRQHINMSAQEKRK